MTAAEVTKAFKEKRIVSYSNGKYRVDGYKTVRAPNGEIIKAVLLFDLRSGRSYSWVPLKDLPEATE